MNKKSKKNDRGKEKNKDRNGSSNARKGAGGSNIRSARLVLIGIVGGIAGVLVLAIFVSGGFTKLEDPSDQRSALILQALSPTTSNSYALETLVAGPSSGINGSSPKVTIVEFGDYQCNSCGHFHSETKDLVIQNLVNTGKARFMFKDYPINDRIYAPRDGSTLAAEAAYCAGDHGRFWEYHDQLYSMQEREGVEWISLGALVKFAKDVGISDTDQFSQCLESHAYRDYVRENFKLAQDLGLNATPTFLIIAEGKEPQIVVGAHPYSTFERVVSQMSVSS